VASTIYAVLWKAESATVREKKRPKTGGVAPYEKHYRCIAGLIYLSGFLDRGKEAARIAVSLRLLSRLLIFLGNVEK